MYLIMEQCAWYDVARHAFCSRFTIQHILRTTQGAEPGDDPVRLKQAPPPGRVSGMKGETLSPPASSLEPSEGFIPSEGFYGASMTSTGLPRGSVGLPASFRVSKRLLMPSYSIPLNLNDSSHPPNTHGCRHRYPQKHDVTSCDALFCRSTRHAPGMPMARVDPFS